MALGMREVDVATAEIRDAHALFVVADPWVPGAMVFGRHLLEPAAHDRAEFVHLGIVEHRTDVEKAGLSEEVSYLCGVVLERERALEVERSAIAVGEANGSGFVRALTVDERTQDRLEPDQVLDPASLHHLNPSDHQRNGSADVVDDGGEPGLAQVGSWPTSVATSRHRRRWNESVDRGRTRPGPSVPHRSQARCTYPNGAGGRGTGANGS